MVLFDQIRMEQPSLSQHCMTLFEDEGRKISKQALDKRFTDSAVLFVQSLFTHYLQSQLLPKKLPSEFSHHFSAIRLMDSTEFKLPECLAADFPGFDGDGTKSCTQIQFEYDILSGQINDLSVGDARIIDSAYADPLLHRIQPRNLIIRDLGYSKIESFKKIEAQGAYYISKLHHNINIYEKRGEDFVPLSLKTLLKRLKASDKEYLDLPIYLGSNVKHPVRLTANLLTKQAVQRRLQKKIYRKNKNPQKYKYLSQMNLLITNVPREMLSANRIYTLYKLRWQIELIFKTWKSILKIDKTRKMKADRFKCYLLGKLLWILINWEVCFLFNDFVVRRKNRLLSIYKCFNIIKMQVRLLEKIVLQQRLKLRQWLTALYEILSEYGLKENKKGRIEPTKLLAIKLA